MGMAVTERGHQEAAVQVDDVRTVAQGARLRTDSLHHTVGDQHRIGVAGGTRPDHPAGE
jgi:hypothetical protein